MAAFLVLVTTAAPGERARMIARHLALCVCMAALAAGCAGTTSLPATSVIQPAGVHDFDFQVGSWRVHHRVKRASDSTWVEFDGTCINRPLMAGAANVEDHTFEKQSGVTYGIGLRAFDPKTGQWAIWWVDSRDPLGTLDPPVKGRFVNGVGTFYSDGVIDGRPIRTRFIWSHITRDSARWEQAFSSDGGITWDTNWIMEFRRA